MDALRQIWPKLSKTSGRVADKESRNAISDRGPRRARRPSKDGDQNGRMRCESLSAWYVKN
eukprot:2078199-Lingulodinium_polyedra.AAC.1